MATYTLDDIFVFLRKTIPLKNSQVLTPTSDIRKDFGVDGDDFDALWDAYLTTYSVNMDGYLWYFHHNDEGSILSLSSLLFKPPSKQITRIPITPALLLECANVGKWVVKYPEHKPPRFLSSYQAVWLELGCYVLLFIAIAAVAWLWKCYR